jgi:UMF1 family MFS transporter
MIVACVGFWSSLVFYNSYLPEIAAPEDQDRVSARGFVMGYIGSVILQIICFVFVLKPDLFGITTGKASQLSFLLVGIWWWGFGQWALRRLPKGKPATKNHSGNIFTGGYKELHKVWKLLTHMPVLKRFLGAFFFYNMGVQTVMLAATLYGKSELNIPTTNLIIAILIIQLVAIPGAYAIYLGGDVYYGLSTSKRWCHAVLCACYMRGLYNGRHTIAEQKHLCQTNA